jgi:hypothetical protein
MASNLDEADPCDLYYLSYNLCLAIAREAKRVRINETPSARLYDLT